MPGLIEANGLALFAVVEAFDAEAAQLVLKRGAAVDAAEETRISLAGALGVADGAVVGFAQENRELAGDDQVAVAAAGGADGLDFGGGWSWVVSS